MDACRGTDAGAQFRVTAQTADVVGQLVEGLRQQAGAPFETMSGVPPVFMAAMGTPSTLASISTRLNDSGPRDGNRSSAA